jgi:hypothetical protein
MDENKHLIAITIRIAIYAVVLAAATAGVMILPKSIPVRLWHGEEHLLQLLQSAYLVIGIGILALTGYRYKSQWVLAFTLASLLALAFFRECDSLLGHYIHKEGWEAGVVLVLLTAAVVIVPRFKILMASIRRFVNWSSFGILLSGFFIVFISSRLLGQQTFWKEIVGADNARTAGRAIEENVELLGYFLLLIGVVEYAIAVKQHCSQSKTCTPQSIHELSLSPVAKEETSSS